MALDASVLAQKIKNKVVEKKPEMGEIIAPVEGEPTGNLDWLFEAIAESVVEHFVNKAEVKVFVIGLDAGASLVPADLQRFTDRGDPTPVPDSGLQLDSLVLPTTPAPTSTALSIRGLID
jgi:hypothetical protein